METTEITSYEAPAMDRQRIAEEIFEAEETRWAQEIARLRARIRALQDKACGRYSELGRRYVDDDPALARRFQDYRAAMADVGGFLGEALTMAWDEALVALRAAMKRRLHAPGEPAPASGQYEIVDPEGRGTREERTAIQGKPLPPTPERGQRYRLVDSTRNDAGVLEAA